MERSPLATLAGLGIVAVLLMAGMWLFTLNQVADTSVAQTASEIDDSLARSFAPGTKTRATMVRDGTGIAAPRRYIVRYSPAAAVAADPTALKRLAERATWIAIGRVEQVKTPVMVHCVAELEGGKDVQHCFRRTGSAGSWGIEDVVPPPPLPAPSDATDEAER